MMRVASLRMASLLALATLPVLIAACGSDHRLVGRGYGRVATAPAGSVIGGIMNSEIGRQMDEGERSIAANAEYGALEYGQSGEPTAWDNPATRHRGSIVPGRPFEQGNQNCRTYTHTIYRGGPPVTAKGTACREPNGTWRSVYCLTSTHTIYRHGFPVTAEGTTCRTAPGPA